MTRRQVLVQLDEAQIDRLDGVAAEADASRSELIRQAIDLYLEATDEAVADVRYAEAYRRIPEDVTEFARLREVGLAAWPER